MSALQTDGEDKLLKSEDANLNNEQQQKVLKRRKKVSKGTYNSGTYKSSYLLLQCFSFFDII